MTTRSRSRLPIYDKPQPARLILARAMGISIDEAGDALIALMQGGYGVAPRNPTNGMLAAYMEATEPPKHHESVITAIAKARARWQTMLAHGTEMAMSRKRIECDHISAPSCSPCEQHDVTASGTLTEGGDAKQAPGDSLSGAVPKGDAHD